MSNEYLAYIHDFLEHSLNSSGFELISLAGDASARRYCRVVHGGESFVLMIWDAFVNDDNYPFLSVQKHFNKHNVHVPKVVDIAADKGLVLLEDLGDLTLERKFWENQTQDLAMPFYKQAIDELIKIHFLCTKDRAVERTGACTAFKISFDFEKLMWEMNYGREHFLEKFCQINFSSQEAHELKKVFTSICERLHNEDKYICHRDYHSRNLMIKLGSMRVIDFQDARMGPVQYDLVSLIHDSYVDMSEDMGKQILAYYLAQANEHTPKKINRDHFDEIFRVQLLQRCFKACGSFASFYNLRNDKRYLKYLSKTINKVALNLKAFPEYQIFFSILTDHGLLDRDYNLT